LGITRVRDNVKDLTSAKSDLFIVDEPIARRPPKDYDRARRILTTPRIGITKAADLPLRYVIAGNPFVSGRKLM